MQSKIYKYFLFTFFLSNILGISTYYLLSTRHKAILKTIVFHKIGLLDSNWKVQNVSSEYRMRSPTFLIDGLYKSMEGPKSSRYIQLNQSKKLLWITGFQVKAIDAKTNLQISNDYICHMNVDINEEQYYSHFNLQDRIGKQYPRLTSLSNGLEQFDFPKGYGVPIMASDFLNVTTQSLNLNLPNEFKKIKHEILVKYEKENKQLKPLTSTTIFLQLPYNENNPYKSPLDPASNECIPVETKNHSYLDINGKPLSGHWVIPKGHKVYKSSITSQLQLKDSLRLHFSAPHVHPFATTIAIFDKTANKTLFTCKISNFKNKIGLSKIGTFSSETGIWFYPNHEYEIVLEVNNTSKTPQDMMGSMFLFFYDKELESSI